MKKGIVFPKGRGIPYVVDVPDEIDCEWMSKTIGCEWVEIVRPKRLPACFAMIVDEEGLLKDNVLNPVGSWFYETDKHGDPSVGDVLILKEEFGPDGPELAGMTDYEIDKVFNSVGKKVRK